MKIKNDDKKVKNDENDKKTKNDKKIKNDKKQVIKNKKVESKIKTQAGGNVVKASMDVINSFKNLGNSIFKEIHSLTNMQSDINTVGDSQKNNPNDINGPPPFKQPNL